MEEKLLEKMASKSLHFSFFNDFSSGEETSERQDPGEAMEVEQDKTVEPSTMDKTSQGM